MLKRVFALFLAMTMVLSMLPMSVFAADDEDVMETIEEETVEETQPMDEEPTEPEEPVIEEPTEEESQEETEADAPEAEPEEEAEVDAAVRYEKISFINPLYRDILTEEDLVPHDPADNQPFASSRSTRTWQMPVPMCELRWCAVSAISPCPCAAPAAITIRCSMI